MRPYQRALPPAVPAVHVDIPLARTDPQHALFAAITFAPAGDLLALLKDALAAGASLDAHDSEGNDVLTLAIVQDRPHAVGTLLAIGAEIPDVGDDGIDLLMRAIMLDHTECCGELLRAVDFDLLQTDRDGRSALFIAAQCGAAASAQLLLAYGASPSLHSTILSAATLQSVFGINHALEGRQVTPLMVATARGDATMVSLLLAAGADPNAGDMPPLHLAADAHDPDMIQRLINAGADVADSLDWQTDSPLMTALRSGAPFSCLQLLAAGYLFNDDEVSDEESPLMLAVQTGRQDAIALFLAHGADPGEHVPGRWSVWGQAATGPHDPRTWAGNGAQRQLHLLTTTRARRWNASEPDADNAILAFNAILRAGNDAAAIASEGLYPSLVRDFAASLAALPPDVDWQSTRQRALYAATLFDTERILTGTAAPSTSATYLRQADMPLDLEWQCRTDENIAIQRTWLQSASARLIQQHLHQLGTAMSMDFFRQMTDNCPAHTRLNAYIAACLTDSSGLPSTVIDLLATAWYDAARNARRWDDGDLSLEQAGLFVVQHMRMMVAHGVEQSSARIANGPTAHWMQTMQQLASAHLALHGFAKDPLAWLMCHEQRHSLRPVNAKALYRVLGYELGLLPGTCAAIAQGWEEVIDQLAGDVRFMAPDAIWRAAATALSPVIAAAIVTDQSIPLPSALRNLTEHWCVQRTSTLPGRVSVPVIEGLETHRPPSGDRLIFTPAPPPPSPIKHLTSPSDLPEGSPLRALPSPPQSPPQVPPPRPQTDRKRPGDPDNAPRKEARHH
jgi:ankyrin repeat protein